MILVTDTAKSETKPVVMREMKAENSASQSLLSPFLLYNKASSIDWTEQFPIGAQILLVIFDFKI